MSVRKRLSIALPVLAIAALVAPLASAGDPFLTVLAEDDLARAPFARYARMTKAEALTELRERGAIFDEVPAEKAPGVIAPIRLTARLGGVHIHGMLKGEAAQTTPFEIVDARLALSLHDFAGILQKHGIDEVTHFSMYRPGPAGYSMPRPGADEPPPVSPAEAAGRAARPRPARPGLLPALPPLPAPDGKAHATTAARGQARETRRQVAPPTPSEGQSTSRHPAALAIDVASLKKSSGAVLSVANHFAGRIGAKTCGDGVPTPESPEARELLSIVCEAADARLFTYVLSPNFNAAHRDHFHMEIKAGVKWMLIH